MTSNLKYTLDQINKWLQYAEAKNAILLSCSIGTLLFSLKEIIANEKYSASCNLYLLLSPLFISITISMCSFYPITKIRGKAPHSGKKSTTGNLLFWGDIKKYTPSEYLDTYKMHYTKQTTNSKINIDLANQCVINSQIGHKKFISFKISLFFYAIYLAVLTFKTI